MPCGRMEALDMEEARYIGTLDIGGTKILAGIIDPAGRLVARQRIKTQAKRGPEDVIARAASALRELAQVARLPLSALEGVGCSVPGPLERESGVVLFSPNLGWRNVRLAELLEEHLDLPVEIEDDARCAALGEAWKGAARGASNAVYLTISTGIGSGVIINGHIYRGAHGFAGEVGHITLDAAGPPCACGNVGCFEALASGSAIAARARQAIRHGDETMLTQFASDTEQLTAEQVIEAAGSGDAVAVRIIEVVGSFLGVGLAAIASSFDPEIIVLGGGVMNRAELLLKRAQETFQARAVPPLGSLVPVIPAALGDESGLWGAATLLMDERSDQSGR